MVSLFGRSCDNKTWGTNRYPHCGLIDRGVERIDSAHTENEGWVVEIGRSRIQVGVLQLGEGHHGQLCRRN